VASRRAPALVGDRGTHSRLVIRAYSQEPSSDEDEKQTDSKTDPKQIDPTVGLEEPETEPEPEKAASAVTQEKLEKLVEMVDKRAYDRTFASYLLSSSVPFSEGFNKKLFYGAVEVFVKYAGITGTAAVLLGIAFKVDVFGNFHWDPNDAIVGVLCALPLFVLDMVLTVPDHIGDMQDASDETTTPEPSMLTKMGSKYQKETTDQNGMAEMPYLLELALIPVFHLAHEMLYRGVAIGASAKGMDYYLTHVQNVDEKLAGQVSPWVVLALFFSGSALLQWQKLTGAMKVKATQVRKDEKTGAWRVEELTAEAIKKSAKNDVNKMREFKADYEEKVSSVKTYLKMRTTMELYSNISKGFAFIYTGNLLAPLAGSVFSETFFSMVQRLNAYRQVLAFEKVLQERLKAATQENMELKERVKILEPKAAQEEAS